jgi:serine/threonine protein kinase
MKVSEDKSQIILRQVLHGIKYFHSKGIVHRDLKTENIMVIGHDTGNINDLRVKLIDFGMSKFTKDDTKTINLNTFCGTLDFMAPEVISGKGYNNKCDLWSIGVIAYNMLAGFTPFIGKDM